MHLYEKTTGSELVYKGKILTVKENSVELEDGSSAMRELVCHSGGVCVVPVDDDGKVLLVKQFRYPMQSVLLEVPAGKLNAGEEHFECGKRELLEETGAVPDEYTYMGVLYPSPAYLNEQIYMYLATGLHFQKQILDDDEFLDVVRMPLEKAFEMVLSNEIKDAKSQIAIMRAYFMIKK